MIEKFECNAVEADVLWGFYHYVGELGLDPVTAAEMTKAVTRLEPRFFPDIREGFWAALDRLVADMVNAATTKELAIYN